jgi:uncharacterized membrane-anchored protein YjiN (DUF445 family)
VSSPGPLLAVVQPDVSGLRRMKRGATGLLAGTAAVFVASFALPDTTSVGFLRAAAEAGTVGGLADWFAVTALFRHPLGIPVPHTALIPRKKDELATKLGEFVTGNFLTADAVAGQLAEARVVHRAAVQLATPGTAHTVARELAAAVTAGLDTVDEQRLTAYVLELVRRDLARRSYAPVLGAFLARAVEGRAQRPLVDIAIRRAHAHLEAHGEALVPTVKRLLEVHWASILIDSGKLARRLIETATQILAEAAADPEHALRLAVDRFLEGVVDDLRYSPRTARDLDAQLHRLVEDPQLQALVHALLADARASVRASLSESDGDLAARLAELVQGAALRVTADRALEDRLQERLLAGVRYVVEHYGDTAVLLIQRTVAGWEARDASARIEATVGRDLQFIRINGTVVGALAGLVLHSVALVAG